MTKHPQTAANTRYAFASIAVMLAAFFTVRCRDVAALGVDGGHTSKPDTASLYAIVLFAVLGGIFSVRVAYLRKKNGA